MPEPPDTRASLLVRIRDADAADLMQEVFRSVASAAGRLDYDPKRGSFRNWLYTVTRNKLYNFLDGRRRHERGSGGSGAQQVLEERAVQEEDAAALWDQEYER